MYIYMYLHFLWYYLKEILFSICFRVLSEPYSLTSVHGLYTQKRIGKQANNKHNIIKGSLTLYSETRVDGVKIRYLLKLHFYMNTNFDSLDRHTDGRKTHRHYMNTENTDIQTDNMCIVQVMNMAAGVCIFVCLMFVLTVFSRWILLTVLMILT